MPGECHALPSSSLGLTALPCVRVGMNGEEMKPPEGAVNNNKRKNRNAAVQIEPHG